MGQQQLHAKVRATQYASQRCVVKLRELHHRRAELVVVMSRYGRVVGGDDFGRSEVTAVRGEIKGKFSTFIICNMHTRRRSRPTMKPEETMIITVPLPLEYSGKKQNTKELDAGTRRDANLQKRS